MNRTHLTDEAIRRALTPAPAIAPPADFRYLVEHAIGTVPQRRWWWHQFALRIPRRLVVPAQLLLLLILLLIVVLLAGALIARQKEGRGLFVAVANELRLIDPDRHSVATILTSDENVWGVTRSPDGSLVTFWLGQTRDDAHDLELVRADGTGQRKLATEISSTPKLLSGPTYGGGIDVWTADNRHLATAIRATAANGQADRIMVVDTETDEARLVGPTGATSPLFSPDGAWIAFTHEPFGRPQSLALMRRDGSDVREISTNLDVAVSGPDSWSLDGRWIWFDAGDGESQHAVYRSDVETGLAEQLTPNGFSAAPALSPDGEWVAYLVFPNSPSEPMAIWIMSADGQSSRLLLADADTRGWSPDSKFILAERVFPDSGAELVRVEIATGAVGQLFARDSCAQPCFRDVSWGQPRP